MTIDFPDWMPASQEMLSAWLGVTTEIAGLIATGDANGAPGGVPLLTLNNVLDKQANYVITPLAPYDPAAFQINQPSYDIVVELQIAAGATIPWLILELAWTDTSLGIAVVTAETWVLPVTAGGVNVFSGRGITKGSSLSVQMTNLDPAENVTMSYGVTQHSRIVNRDDIRSLGFNGATGFNAAPSDMTTGVVTMWQPTIAGGANTTVLLPLFAGKVQFSLQEAAQASRFLIRAPGESVAGGANLASAALLDTGPIAANTPYTATVTLPKTACSLELLNTGGAGNTFALSGVIEEY